MFSATRAHPSCRPHRPLEVHLVLFPEQKTGVTRRASRHFSVVGFRKAQKFELESRQRGQFEYLIHFQEKRHFKNYLQSVFFFSVL